MRLKLSLEFQSSLKETFNCVLINMDQMLQIPSMESRAIMLTR